MFRLAASRLPQLCPQTQVCDRMAAKFEMKASGGAHPAPGMPGSTRRPADGAAIASGILDTCLDDGEVAQRARKREATRLPR